MKKYSFVLLICTLFVLKSCKSTQATTNTSGANIIANLSAKKVIASHYKNSADFNTLRAKLKLRFDNGKKSLSPAVSLRIQKDQKIWLSAKVFGIVVGKILITPTRVQYYEVVNNTYFDGDFALLSNVLGMPLDFDKVQNLLVGAPLFDVEKEKHTITIVNQNYVLKPKAPTLLKKHLAIQANTYTLSEQQFLQPTEKRTLRIHYPAYQKMNNHYFPKALGIHATHGQKSTTIDMEYKDISYNTELSFPFQIPPGAKQIRIK